MVAAAFAHLDRRVTKCKRRPEVAALVLARAAAHDKGGAGSRGRSCGEPRAARRDVRWRRRVHLGSQRRAAVLARAGRFAGRSRCHGGRRRAAGELLTHGRELVTKLVLVLLEGSLHEHAPRVAHACGGEGARLSGNQWQSVAISGNQWQSVAISGDQWQSVAISGNQWQSVAPTWVCHPRRSVPVTWRSERRSVANRRGVQVGAQVGVAMASTRRAQYDLSTISVRWQAHAPGT